MVCKRNKCSVGVVEVPLAAEAQRVALVAAHLRDARLLLLDHFHAHQLLLNAERRLLRVEPLQVLVAVIILSLVQLPQLHNFKILPVRLRQLAPDLLGHLLAISLLFQQRLPLLPLLVLQVLHPSLVLLFH